jgi:hypothetical protein
MWYKKSDQTSNDLTLKVIAKKAGFPYVVVHGFWDLCLEAANKNEHRGDINTDIDEWEILTGLEVDKIKELFELFESRGLIENSRIKNWNNYQSEVVVPKTVAERVALHRERKRNSAESTCNDTVTGGNVSALHVTQDKDIDLDKDKDLEKGRLVSLDLSTCVRDEADLPASSQLNWDFSGNHPVLIAHREHSGPILTVIEADGNRISEFEWVAKWLKAGLVKSGVKDIGHLNFVQLVSGMYPWANNQSRIWFSRAPAQRMAALYFSARNPNVTNPLTYAQAGFSKKWNGLMELIPQAEEYLKSNDTEVDLRSD